MADDVKHSDRVENPEWTEQDFSEAIPFKDAHPVAYDDWKRSRGRPTIDDKPKVHIGFRLAADVVEAVKATGKGYNSRVERVLRDAIAEGKL